MESRPIDRHMFYGAKKNIFSKAAELRHDMTKAEVALWNVLRNKTIFPARWKRQHPVDIFIVDFYCHKYKLAIEVDGEIHLNKENREYDEGREYDIKQLDIRVLRFTNKEIFENIEMVTNHIIKVINSLSPL